MESQDDTAVALAATEEAFDVFKQNKDDADRVLSKFAGAYIFMLARVCGKDAAVTTLQRISRRFVSRETEKIRLAVNNDRGAE